jgi:hypothetical protein
MYKLFPISKYKLCYIDGNKAYFTTQALSKQDGDDWNDAPYEHNAGAPYEWHKEHDKDTKPWSIATLYFEATNPVTPCTHVQNSEFSVDMVNSKRHIPWLVIKKNYSDEIGVEIWAGTRYLDFVYAIQDNGGRVWVDPIQRFNV